MKPYLPPVNPLAIALDVGMLGLDIYDAFSSSKNLPVSRKSKVSKYRRKNKSGVAKYNKSDIVSSGRSRKVDIASDLATVAIGGGAMLYDGMSEYSRAVESARASSSPVEPVVFPEYNGDTLIDSLKYSSEVSKVGLDNLTTVLGLQIQSMSDIAVSIQTGTLVQSQILPQIYSGIVGIVSSLENLGNILSDSSSSSAPVVNIDLQSVSSSIDSLKENINPQSRLDFYDKHNQIADYKLTPATHTDMHGNDSVTMSPLDIQTKKNLGDSVDKALKNNTTMDDVDFTDLLPDLDLANITGDIGKLFQFNGVYESLQQLVANMGEDGQGFVSPDLKG